MFSSVANFVANSINPHREITQQASLSNTTIPFDLSENYKLFTSKYHLQSLQISESEEWLYYDTGGDKTPLILIPGTTGTANQFFQQLLSLGLRGYRLISVTIPSVFTVELFLKSFNKFLSYLNISKFHLLGVSLGGYLSLSYICEYPHRVLSLILTNAFISTRLFQTNAPWISQDIMPEFYVRRYITGALPKHNKFPLSIDFVLKQINTLNKTQLLSRLSLNFSQYNILIDKLNKYYSQINITIMDALDITTLDDNMKEQLYNILPNAKYSLIKYGGAFPYLSNYQEYSMLIEVHLRRHLSIQSTHIIATQGNINAPKIKVNITKLFESKSKGESNKKKHNLPNKIGVFDHRRQYHNNEKQSLFNDNNLQFKDGISNNINNYNSDSSQSSDMMEIDHTEHDKRKSLLFIQQSKSYTNSINSSANDSDDDDDDDEPRIIGIEHIQNNYDQEIANGNYNEIEDENNNNNHTQYYTVNDDKKKQYLLDRKIKKKRYKEYLARKKKAYKKYLLHKNNNDNDMDILPLKIDSKHSKKKKKRKHKKKHKIKKVIDKNGRVIRKKVKRKHKHKHNIQPHIQPHLDKTYIDKHGNEHNNAPEMLKAKMFAYYQKKQQLISNDLYDDDDNDRLPIFDKYAAANRTVLVNDADNNLHDMYYDNDNDLYDDNLQHEQHEHEHEQKDIIDMVDISPRHSTTAEPTDNNDGDNLDEKNNLKNNTKHRKHESILDQVEIHPITEESSQLSQHEPDDEKKSEIINNNNKPRHAHKISRHRALRKKVVDQTPMDLLVNNQNMKPRATMINGHRLIPSYGSDVSLLDSRNRSESNYVPYVGDRERQDSFISELGDYGFLPSDIQPWPMEGNDILSPITPNDNDLREYKPYVAHNAFQSSTSIQLLTEHKINVDDDNVGDSIF